MVDSPLWSRGPHICNQIRRLCLKVHFSHLTALWPAVWPPGIPKDNWGQNTLAYVVQGYQMRIHLKHLVPDWENEMKIQFLWFWNKANSQNKNNTFQFFSGVPKKSLHKLDFQPFWHLRIKWSIKSYFVMENPGL